MSDSYNLKGSDLEKWVCSSDTHSGAPVSKAQSAEAAVAAPKDAKYDKEGDQD